MCGKKEGLQNKLNQIKDAKCEKFSVVVPEIEWPGIITL